MTGLWLTLTGLGIGTLGTMLGTGGGFLLMPILFWLYAERTPAELTAISLAVVFCNAVSGTAAYLYKKRVEVRSGALFALATIPGAWLGTQAIRAFDRATFDPFFGSLMLVASAYLFFRPTRVAPRRASTGWGHVRFQLTERSGVQHEVAYSLPVGLVISMGVGFVSGITGIGGGIVHVPAMTQVLGFPVHIATATSQMILMVSSATSTVVHAGSGALTEGWFTVAWIAPGVIIGAQLGAWLSSRVQGAWIMRGLALCLAIVGLRLVFQ